MKSCEICKKPFVPSKFHPKQRFCSSCRRIAKNKADRERKKKKFPQGYNTIKKCLNCKKTIVFNKNSPLNAQMTKKFCSPKCRYDFSRKKNKK